SGMEAVRPRFFRMVEASASIVGHASPPAHRLGSGGIFPLDAESESAYKAARFRRRDGSVFEIRIARANGEAGRNRNSEGTKVPRLRVEPVEEFEPGSRDLSHPGAHRAHQVFFLESLILAQNERWRRA